MWHLCGRQKNEKVEIIQKQSLRYVYNDYSSTTYATIAPLVDKANRPLKFTNTLRRLIWFVDKCIKGRCPAY